MPRGVSPLPGLEQPRVKDVLLDLGVGERGEGGNTM